MSDGGIDQPFLTREYVQLMIAAGIEAYDVKTSLPRHQENKAEMHGMKVVLDKVCEVLTKIEGGLTAFKWISGIVAFAWSITEITTKVLLIVQALRK